MTGGFSAGARGRRGDGPHQQDAPQSPPRQGPRGNEASTGRAKEGETNRAEAKHRPLGSGTAATPNRCARDARPRPRLPGRCPRPPAAPLRTTRSLARKHASPARQRAASKSRRLKRLGDGRGTI